MLLFNILDYLPQIGWLLNAKNIIFLFNRTLRELFVKWFSFFYKYWCTWVSYFGCRNNNYGSCILVKSYRSQSCCKTSEDLILNSGISSVKIGATKKKVLRKNKFSRCFCSCVYFTASTKWLVQMFFVTLEIISSKILYQN